MGPVMASALKIPFTYCWSPALVPKPPDWPAHIDVCGFFFRNPSPYNPPKDIDQFLRNGPPPVYIGFGSIVLDDPTKMTASILDAVHMLGIRAIISRGWSNLGGNASKDNKNVLFIDDCPHEWLFQHVAAVVHHGGAGTAACGLRNACPTTVVPFFGDQPFWGEMIAAAGAGPKPIPHKLLTTESLAEALHFCLTPEAKKAAEALSSQMIHERGVEAAVQSFHANLPLETMQCAVLPNAVATLNYKKDSIRLSKLAAQVLIENGVILSTDLENHATNPFRIENVRWDPLTSTGSAAFGIVGDMGTSARNIISDPYDELKRHETDTSETKSSGAVVAGKMVGGVAKNVGKFALNFYKGVIVDLPLATTEGFRNAPRLYGEEPKNHGEVTGVVSGLQVGAKNFAYGMMDGFSDPFKQTYESGKKEGAIGYAKGFGKGMAGLVTKTSAATVGIIAYPGDGICKSIRYLAHGGTRKKIKIQKLIESEWLVSQHENDVDVRRILQVFERLRKGKEKA